jgi:hypothetical protein
MRSGQLGFVFWLLCGLLCFQAALQLRASFSWGPDSWPLTEFLIDYSGGFVRRGLPGTLFWWISSITGVQANHLVIGIGLLTFLGLSAWTLCRLRERFHPALLVSCVVLGIPAYQEGILRKDCVGLLVLVLAVKFLRVRPTGWRLCVPALACSLAVLSHETFFFYGVAGLLLARHPQWSEGRYCSRVFRTAVLSPALLAFFFCLIWHGNEDVARTIHQTWTPLWERLGFSGAEPGAAIAALGWSKREAFDVGTSVILSGWYQTTAWVLVFTFSFFLAVLFTGENEPDDGKPRAKVEFAAILLVQLACISPLFLLGMDYGRWLFFWVMSSMILFHFGFRAPDWLERICDTRL